MKITCKILNPTAEIEIPDGQFPEITSGEPDSGLSDILAHLKAEVERLVEVARRGHSPYRDRAGVAAYLNCSEGHVDSLAARGLLPSDRYDALRPLWRVESIEKYLVSSTSKRKCERKKQE